MNATWWEKTVEYAFVVAAFKGGKCDLAAPLAGKHERLASDAVFANASKFVLIEFKRDKNQIDTEKSLFHNYETAKIKLQNYKHHFLVYGATSQNDTEQFQLNAQTYFNGKSLSSALDCLSKGVHNTEFYNYLKLLAELKKEDGRSTIGGHVTTQDMSTVIGVSSDGKMISSVSIHEYAPDLFPLQADKVDDTYHPPSNSNRPSI